MGCKFSSPRYSHIPNRLHGVNPEDVSLNSVLNPFLFGSSRTLRPVSKNNVAGFDLNA